ncbi:MAG TPA: class I SAM-dependent methyltransferase [Polyangiaceae bacterium]|nr:class I SAM-dependent methyltransferase [Polyangiaceae bacterium]
MSQKGGPLAAPEPWDLVSKGYAEEASYLMRAFSVRAIELMEPGVSARVIDVAAGPGTLTLELAQRVASIDAIDFAPAMIEELQAALVTRNITNVTARVADGQSLPFGDERFDFGFSMFGLMFFPDRPRGYSELLRVLKPGGRAVVSSWAPLMDSSLMRGMFGAIHEVDPNVPPPQRDPLGLENPDVLAAELTAAGFRDVAVEAVTRFVPPITSAEEVWHRMSRSSAPLVLLRNRLGESEWQRGTERARAFLERYLRENPGELSSTALLGYGTKP